jgi:hypothetical protein
MYIVYHFSSEIDSLFKDKLNDSTNFYLHSTPDYYDLTIDNDKNYIDSLTNRRVFMFGKFYPIMLDYDVALGTTTSSRKILEQYKTDGYFTYSKRIMLEEGFHVRFNKNSLSVIASGWELSGELDKKK